MLAKHLVTASLAALLAVTAPSAAFAGAAAEPPPDAHEPEDPRATRAPAPPDAMAFLGRMVGGAWYQGEEFFQIFEWGAGQQAIRSTGYFVVGGQPKLVSEGIWFWHPAERVIRAYGVAIDMPMVTWEYETRIAGTELQHELTAYAADGTATVFRELWTFSDANRYEWTLLESSADGWVRAMGGPFERRETLPDGTR